MSGGSLEYVYSRVEDAATTIRGWSSNPLHLAFATHLEKCAKALHDLEWVFSGDRGSGDEIEAIKAAISEQQVLDEAVKLAEDAREKLEAALLDAVKALEGDG